MRYYVTLVGIIGDYQRNNFLAVVDSRQGRPLNIPFYPCLADRLLLLSLLFYNGFPLLFITTRLYLPLPFGVDTAVND